MREFAKIGGIKLFGIVVSSILSASCGGLAPQDQSSNLPQNQNTNLIIVRQNSPTPTPLPIIVYETTPSPSPETATDSSIVVVEKLIVPVAGVKREDLSDTFKDSRDGGRVHDAIDIMAPQGTPVVAAGDGEIARFFDSERGGITIYQFSRDKKLIYYYAHLQRRADNLQEKQFVKQGTVIGYVGDTGNSGAGNFHLHFAVWIVNDPKRYWDGTNVNPYTLLR